MLRIHQSSSVAAAKSYYTSGLESEGYYSKEGDVGRWFGKAGEMLSLAGEIERSDFEMLCANKSPGTGARLNPRGIKNRKVGYDFTFSAPKSVSILYEVLGDHRILEVFKISVRETMKLVEREVEVRVRKKGAVATRRTGNLIYGEFIHHTTRPVLLPGDELTTVDPALHCHCYCYCFNTSFDAVEGIFKAADFFPIKRDAPYFEAVFHNKLANGLAHLGYGIQPKSFGFEVRGVGNENIRQFSSRTAEIEQLAIRLGIANNAEAKSHLGARSRRLKDARSAKADVLRNWRRRLDRRELCYHQQQPGNPSMTAAHAVDLAITGAFERRSVMPFRRLIAEALGAAVGAATESQIKQEFSRRGDLVKRVRDGVIHVTTHEILDEERRILDFLRRSVGIETAFNPWHIPDPHLDEDQRAAVSSILRSNNGVAVIEGRAGTGKTSLMRSAVAALESAGARVWTYAPTSQASHEVLKGEGFLGSETIQLLLVSPKLQKAITPGSILWIDEAGLLSTREMAALFRIAEERGARIVLSGDSFQHHSVERGDALRLVIESGIVEVCQTRSIYRQRNDRHRQAVGLLSSGDITGAIAILEEMGVIHQAESPLEEAGKVAEEYVQSLTHHRTVLVISPTHGHGRRITTEIRELLLEEGRLSGPVIELDVLQNRNLGAAERSQARFVKEGDVVRFVQNAKGGFCRGERWLVQSSEETGIVIRNANGECRVLPLAAVPHYQVYSVVKREFRVGDSVRVTENLNALDGSRLFNGSIHKFTGFDKQGNLVLDRRHRLPRSCGFLDHGYVVTSYASQGKTVDKVIISQSTANAGAASMEQFYVSVSRSRNSVSIWTDDKASMIRSVLASDDRMLASELGMNQAEQEEVLAHECEEELLEMEYTR